MLPAIVDVLTEATDCHACFVYLRDGDRLRLRAASSVFAHAVGRVELGMDEGLAGWVARHREPAFIRDNALADPRMRYVPELDEERFQSMVAVPIVGRSGAVIGVVVLHTRRRASSARRCSTSSCTSRRSWPARSRTRACTRRRAARSRR